MRERAYEGCAFIAVDLDNQNEGTRLAALQQFAVAVSNISPVEARVSFRRAGEEASLETRVLAPGELAVVGLPSCGVDAAPGETEREADEDVMPHSAITSCGVHIDATAPIIAYQFNPLEPIGTYSEDASLLLPTTAWGDRTTVIGWPETIGPRPPLTEGSLQGRAFLTVVAATACHVRVALGALASHVRGLEGEVLRPGALVEADLEPGQVLNLETTSLGADFSGTVVTSDHDVGVFSGNEAAQVPFALTGTRVVRYAAADHLEEQLMPDRAVGRSFVLASLPSRSRAVTESVRGRPLQAVVAVVELDVFRVLNVGAVVAHVETGLPVPLDRFEIEPLGIVQLEVTGEVRMVSDVPLSVMQFTTGQEFVGLPVAGGDPSSLVVGPIDQYRTSYTVLVPEHHAFDFLQLVVEEGATTMVDDEPAENLCSSASVEGSHMRVLRCPLSAPVIDGSDPREPTVEPGVQNAGVHRLRSSAPFGVTVYGFDSYKSYAYAGGLQLSTLD